MNDYHKKLIYLSEHRGMREADILLGQFARGGLSTLDPTQVALFYELLQCPDQDILTWFLGQQPPPEKFAVLVEMIRDKR